MKAFFITIFFFGSERKKSINRRPINRPHRQELHTINEKKTGARIQKWKKFHPPKKKEIVFLVVVVVVVQIWKAPPPKKKRHASPRNETQIQKKNRRKKLNFSKKRKRKSATTFSPIDAEPIRFRDKKKWKPHKQKKKTGSDFLVYCCRLRSFLFLGPQTNHSGREMQREGWPLFTEFFYRVSILFQRPTSRKGNVEPFSLFIAAINARVSYRVKFFKKIFLPSFLGAPSMSIKDE